MSIAIVTCQMGQEFYSRYVSPMLANPPAEVWADAEIGLTTAEHPEKVWWLAVDENERVLAFCAAWPGEGGDTECGHNYELGHRERTERHWPTVFAARQLWLLHMGVSAYTYIFDQPLELHLAHGWRLDGDEGVSELDHHWQRLVWP
jgi:hypothetical protein